jgi:hypothetical protein
VAETQGIHRNALMVGSVSGWPPIRGTVSVRLCVLMTAARLRLGTCQRISPLSPHSSVATRHTAAPANSDIGPGEFYKLLRSRLETLGHSADFRIKALTDLPAVVSRLAN